MEVIIIFLLLLSAIVSLIIVRFFLYRCLYYVNRFMYGKKKYKRWKESKFKVKVNQIELEEVEKICLSFGVTIQEAMNLLLYSITRSEGISGSLLEVSHHKQKEEYRDTSLVFLISESKWYHTIHICAVLNTNLEDVVNAFLKSIIDCKGFPYYITLKSLTISNDK